MKMKKLLPLLLAAVMALSACGSKANQNNGETETGGTEAVQTPAGLGARPFR